MPLVVTEFGLADEACRAAFFDAVYARVEHALGITRQHGEGGPLALTMTTPFLDDDGANDDDGEEEGACAPSALAGSCFWMLAHEGYPNADGTNVTVALPPCAAAAGSGGGGGGGGCEDNAAVLRLVARHAARVRAWNEHAGRGEDA
jgi:hypothetical protein